MEFLLNRSMRYDERSEKKNAYGIALVETKVKRVHETFLPKTFYQRKEKRFGGTERKRGKMSKSERLEGKVESEKGTWWKGKKLKGEKYGRERQGVEKRSSTEYF